MDAKRIAEIEARASAATPGPWERQDQHGMDTHWIDVVSAQPVPGAVDSDEEVAEAEPQGNRHIVHKSSLPRHDAHVAQIHRDLDFIAHAREDVPALIAEVRRLRALLCGESPEVEPKFQTRIVEPYEPVNSTITTADHDGYVLFSIDGDRL